MSTSWTFMKGRSLTYKEIAEKTPIKKEVGEDGGIFLVLDGNYVRTFVHSDDEPIHGFTRYGGNDVLPFLKTLVREFDLHIVSEYFLREYLETDDPITDEDLDQYRRTIIEMIQEENELLKHAPDQTDEDDSFFYNSDIID